MAIKYRHDHYDAKFFLTGSSSFYLKNLFPLAFLEGTYFIFLVEPFSRNPDREVSGARKVYFCDNGFLSLVGRVSEGSLLENAVYLNLRKQAHDLS